MSRERVLLTAVRRALILVLAALEDYMELERSIPVRPERRRLFTDDNSYMPRGRTIAHN